MTSIAGVGECIETQADFESSLDPSVSEVELLEVDFLEVLARLACPLVFTLLWETKWPEQCSFTLSVSATGVMLPLSDGPPKEIVLLFEFLRS